MSGVSSGFNAATPAEIVTRMPGENALQSRSAMIARNLERLREIIADLDWSAFSAGMRVTISAGVATLKADETPDTLLARADSGLYAAKARGRNRIASA